jgi:hypothetical protein
LKFARKACGQGNPNEPIAPSTAENGPKSKRIRQDIT